MATIQKLFERLGFVKLNRFGLVLTPEGRILSMRPAVLDDGMGGRIVGWEDADLAAAELPAWGTQKPVVPVAPMAFAQTVPMSSMAPIPSIPRPKAPTAPPPIPVRATGGAPIVRPAPVVAASVAVAPSAEPPEDDWEWTIALARARAAADDVIAAVPPPIAKPVAQPAPLAALPKTPPQTQWAAQAYQPKPLASVTPIAPARLAKASSPVMAARASSPKTIIPVPKLASVKSAPASPVIPLTTARRTARGTATQKLEDTRPMIEIGASNDFVDETNTQINLELPDETRPNLVLPSIVRAHAR